MDGKAQYGVVCATAKPSICHKYLSVNGLYLSTRRFGTLAAGQRCVAMADLQQIGLRGLAVPVHFSGEI